MVTVDFSARVIPNFALQHFMTAVLFRDQLLRIEAENTGREFGQFFEHIRSYASSCIICAAASLEGLINELFIAHGGRLRTILGHNFETKFWGSTRRHFIFWRKYKRGIVGKPTLEKYQQALKMLELNKFQKADAAYGNALILMQLRNWFVHYKPNWDAPRSNAIDLVSALAGRFSLSPFVPSTGDFLTQQCMSAGCAQWIVETVGVFVREFGRRTRIDDDKLAPFAKTP